jgi:PKD repeat protein
MMLHQLRGSGTGVGDLTYEWDFESDGTYDSTAQNPSHDYPAGTYTATLRVTDDCSSVTDSVEIKIDEYSTPIANVEGQCYQLGCETEITATLSGRPKVKEPYTYTGFRR